MAKGDREALRAVLKVIGDDESVEKGKVAGRSPKPSKKAIVDGAAKSGRGQDNPIEGGEGWGSTQAEEEAGLAKTQSQFLRGERERR